MARRRRTRKTPPPKLSTLVPLLLIIGVIWLFQKRLF
jgi:hypothetical protein